MTNQGARFAAELLHFKTERGLSYRELARLANYSSSYLEELVKGKKPANAEVAARLDRAFGTGRRFREILSVGDDGLDAGIEAIELVRRVTASDVSAETLNELERAANSMAMLYATTPPEELLLRVRKYLGYVDRLLDARKTLDQGRRLLIIGGWLSLLRATLHIDLTQATAAAAHLDAAATLAEQTGHREIAAWCLETRAWQVLTAGEYRRALDLSQQAQAVAPAGSSVYIQATAQEGRAWARLGDSAQTGEALNRVEQLAEHLDRPEHPEHHYQYDPAKAHSYAATTLAWVGDPAAVSVAQEVIKELRRDGARPRRVASAQLDLGLALLSAGKADEAAAEAREAILSGRVVSSNWWRAAEVVGGVVGSGAPEAADLLALAHEHRPAITAS
ncbi:helix-turn-helix transcriptional regulator [Actinoplanes sp. KI2]|uniref:helix-turn-helix transcriptional regulator n=1 Tax=Actinoplanes sp. KI2 TaxID=2983315 RepID=UPI0021D5E25C|nr:helix-turn-helix transcriptional regulator [Actinoplanes sp. KI2]MCU7726456.1 helix-turn-helix transcriptional regulator [Actinoplanes sp. KI2]